MHYGGQIQGKYVEKILPETATVNNTPNPADLTWPGGIYQVDLHTNGVSDPEGAINQILALEQSTPDLKFLYIDASTTSNVITVQFMDTGPGQFSFIGLLGAIPAILAIVFIAVVAYVLWVVYRNNPLTLWVLGALGAGVAVFYFLNAKYPLAPTAAIRGSGGRSISTGKVEAAVAANNKVIGTAEKRIEVAQQEIDKCLSDLSRQAEEASKRNLAYPLTTEQRCDAIEKRNRPIIEREQKRVDEAEADNKKLFK